MSSHRRGDNTHAMIDLMSGLAGIFLVVAVSYIQNQERSATEKAEANAEAKAKVQATAELKEGRADLFAFLGARLADAGLVGAGDGGVYIDADRDVLRFDESVAFDLGAAEPRDDSRPTLDRLAQTLDSVLMCFSDDLADAGTVIHQECGTLSKMGLDTVLIEGHADSRGQADENRRLSASRAASTFRVMVETVPRLKRLRNVRGQPLLGIAGYGADRPLEEDPKASGNRRIEIRFVVSPRLVPDAGSE